MGTYAYDNGKILIVIEELMNEIIKVEPIREKENIFNIRLLLSPNRGLTINNIKDVKDHKDDKD